MGKKKHVVAIFKFSPSIPQFMLDALSFKNKLTTPPGNTRVTVDPLAITNFGNHLDALKDAETNVKPGGNIPAADRDEALEVVKTDVRGFVALVQLAANAAPDELTSVGIVEDCGLHVRKVTARAKPDIEAKPDKKQSGLITLISKAADKKLAASYEWQSSADGINFTQVKVTTRSRYKWVSGLAAGTKVYLRKRVITNKDVTDPSWSQIIWTIVT